jgi:hypothetical protein
MTNIQQFELELEKEAAMIQLQHPLPEIKSTQTQKELIKNILLQQKERVHRVIAV